LLLVFGIINLIIFGLAYLFIPPVRKEFIDAFIYSDRRFITLMLILLLELILFFGFESIVKATREKQKQ